MGPRVIRQAAWAILGLLILGALLTGCGSSGSSTGSSGSSTGAPPRPAAFSQQQLNNQRLSADMRALDRGILTSRHPGDRRAGGHPERDSH
jgi:hypothetical protein